MLSMYSQESLFIGTHRSEGLPIWAAKEQFYNCDNFWKSFAKKSFIEKVLEWIR